MYLFDYPAACIYIYVYMYIYKTTCRMDRQGVFYENIVALEYMSGYPPHTHPIGSK